MSIKGNIELNIRININKSDKGFSLLEVMVAMALIAIALVAALGLQSRSLSLAEEAKFDTTESLLAQQKIAEIESGNVEDLTDSSGDFGDDFPGYQWKLSIQNSSFSQLKAPQQLKQVDLNIYRDPEENDQYKIRIYLFNPAKG